MSRASEHPLLERRCEKAAECRSCFNSIKLKGMNSNEKNMYKERVKVASSAFEDHQQYVYAWEARTNQKVAEGGARVNRADLGLGSKVEGVAAAGIQTEETKGYLYTVPLYKKAVSDGKDPPAKHLQTIKHEGAWVTGVLLPASMPNPEAIRIFGFGRAEVCLSSVMAKSDTHNEVQLAAAFTKGLSSSTIGGQTEEIEASDGENPSVARQWRPSGLNQASSADAKKRQRDNQKDSQAGADVDSSDEEVPDFLNMIQVGKAAGVPSPSPRRSAETRSSRTGSPADASAKAKAKGRPRKDAAIEVSASRSRSPRRKRAWRGSLAEAPRSVASSEPSAPKLPKPQKAAKKKSSSGDIISHLSMTHLAAQKITTLASLLQHNDGIKGQNAKALATLLQQLDKMVSNHIELFIPTYESEPGITGADVLAEATVAKERGEVLEMFVRAGQPAKGNRALKKGVETHVACASVYCVGVERAIGLAMPLCSQIWVAAVRVGVDEVLQKCVEGAGWDVWKVLDGNLPHADVACVLKSMSMTPISAAPAGMRCDVQKEVLEGKLIAVLRDASLAAEESAADKAIKKTECAMRVMLLDQTPNILHAPLKNTLSSLRLVMENDEKVTCSAEELQTSLNFLCSPDCCLHRHKKFLPAFTDAIAEKVSLVARMRGDTIHAPKLKALVAQVEACDSVLPSKRPTQLEDRMVVCGAASRLGQAYTSLCQLKASVSANFMNHNEDAIAKVEGALGDMVKAVLLRPAWRCSGALEGIATWLETGDGGEEALQTLRDSVSQWQSANFGLNCVATPDVMTCYDKVASVRAECMEAVERMAVVMRDNDWSSLQDVIFNKHLLLAMKKIVQLAMGNHLVSRQHMSPEGSELNGKAFDLARALKDLLLPAVTKFLKFNIESMNLGQIVSKMTKRDMNAGWSPSSLPTVSEANLDSMNSMVGKVVEEHYFFFKIADARPSCAEWEFDGINLTLKDLGVQKTNSIELGWLCCAMTIGRAFAALRKLEKDTYADATFVTIREKTMPTLTILKNAIVYLENKGPVYCGAFDGQQHPETIWVEVLQKRCNGCVESICEAVRGLRTKSLEALRSKAPTNVVDEVESADNVAEQKNHFLKIVQAGGAFKKAWRMFKKDADTAYAMLRALHILVEVDDVEDIETYQMPEAEADLLMKMRITLCTLGALQALYGKVEGPRSAAAEAANDQFSALFVPAEAVPPKVTMLLKAASA